MGVLSTFSPPLANPPPSCEPIAWTVSGGTAPYTWEILKLDGSPFLEHPPILITAMNERHGSGTPEPVTGNEVYAQATEHAGWARVRATDRLGSSWTQDVWNGEIFLYAPDGKLWQAPSSAWTLSPMPPPAHFPPPKPEPGHHMWGIAWAPKRPSLSAIPGTSLTCYILNVDALHAARMLTVDVVAKPHTVIYPLSLPIARADGDD